CPCPQHVTQPPRVAFPTRRSSDLSTAATGTSTSTGRAKRNPHRLRGVSGSSEAQVTAPGGHRLVRLTLPLACLGAALPVIVSTRSEEHTSELQSRVELVSRLLIEI